MGKTISSLFTTQCYQCQGTGTNPEYQFRVCQTCQGEKYMSVFRIPECMKSEEKPSHSHHYNITGFEIR